MADEVLLMTPGPVMLSPAVIEALGRPAEYHHDIEFVAAFDRCAAGLGRLLETDGLVAILPGSGRLALEAAIATILRAGERSLHLVNGLFATWMVEMARRVGARVTVLEGSWGESVRPEDLRQSLARARAEGDPFRLVTAAHCETSTGQLHPVGEYGQLCGEHGALLLVDAISSAGCAPLSMTRDGIDLCVTASQKGLGAPLGLSVAALSARARHWLRQSDRPPPASFSLDLTRWEPFYETAPPRPFPVVPSPHLLRALEASLGELEAERLEARLERHSRAASATRAGLRALGLSPFAGRPSPSVTAVALPEGISSLDVAERLLAGYRIRVAIGMGPFTDRLLRIGHMGRQAEPEPLLRTLGALADVLAGLGHCCDSRAAGEAFKASLGHAGATRPG